jgi:hypothetical protein
MFKQELQTLHERRCVMEETSIKLPQGPESRFVVSFSLTRGQLIALHYALLDRNSVAGNNARDILAFFGNAAHRAEVTLP